MAKRRRNTIDLAAGLGLASLHTGITLFYRLPMLAASFSASGKERHARELNRMAGEKAGAMIEGAFDAQKEILRLAANVMRRPFDLAAMTQTSASIVNAALRPAFRRVKANSRRLSLSRDGVEDKHHKKYAGHR
jgi:hypothetical protein